MKSREFLIAGSLEIKAGYPSEAVLPVWSVAYLQSQVRILTQILAIYPHGKETFAKKLDLLVNLAPVR